MLLDHSHYVAPDAEPYAPSPSTPFRAATPRWTVVLPFHNERSFLPISLQSLAAQSEPFHLILVDNGSTDGSGPIAQALCDLAGIDATLLIERRPGKVSALQCGAAAARTELIATCDADTIYPPDYLARAARLLDRPGTAAAIAATAAPEAGIFKRRVAGLHIATVGRLLPQQCHNGGAGQVFRASALRAAGGFDPAIWNWVLEDHEIMARIEHHGRIAYDRHFLCAPISRPRTASTAGWRLIEQLRYHMTGAATRIGFFHQYLGPRLRERALSSDRLRRDAQYRDEPRGRAELHPVRG